MKEFAELVDSKIGAFFNAIKGLAADAVVSTFASNSGAMVQGHKGKVVSIDYEPVQGRVEPLREDQTITVDGEVYRLAKKGEMPKAPTLRFDTGRTMTLGLLTQGAEKTTIKLKGKSAKPFAEFTKTELQDLIERTLECKKFFRDDTNPILRNAGTDEQRKYPANCYIFEEI